MWRLLAALRMAPLLRCGIGYTFKAHACVQLASMGNYQTDTRAPVKSCDIPLLSNQAVTTKGGVE